MAEPGSIQSSWSVEDEMVLEWTDPINQGAAMSLNLQLHLDLGAAMPPGSELLPYPEMPLTAAEGGHNPGTNSQPLNLSQPTSYDPESDLPSLRSQIQKQVNRIQSLERALDQSLIVVAELRKQLVNQQFLEDQLAATEEIANIQQQAITQLKQQLAQHQSTSPVPFSPPPVTVIAPSLPLEPDPHSFSNLTAKLTDLTQQLDIRQHIIEQLELELDRAQLERQEQQLLIDRLQRPTESTPANHQGSNISLDQELFAAHCKIQELELQISKQATTQAILQHTCHELEQVRDRYHTRAQELELQSADMQEQILHQAQQASEYQTAIQHWKDRYFQGHDYLRRLRDLVQQMDSPTGTDLTELLSAIQILLDTPEPERSHLPISRSPRMDIPDFLARHQRYRVRS